MIATSLATYQIMQIQRFIC